MRAILLLIASAAFAQTPDTAPYPPPGRMVDLGGYRVHLDCAGKGSPAVMIIGGGFSFDWTLVQTQIAQVTRVCVYDASGTAWSDPGPGRGCPAWVNEVRALIVRADIPRPFVLTGFSAAALIARLYAMEYPADVAGLVLVDHAFLPEDVPQPPAPSKAAAPAAEPGAAYTPPAVISMTPVIGAHEDEPGFRNLPPRARQLDRWASSRNPDLPTAETAEQCIRAAESAGKGASHPLGHLPLMIVSTANDAPGYADLQRHLLSLSTDSRQRIASKSFHSIEISQPDVVAGGILEVIAAVRNRSALN